ncbi:MAG TPA: pentapeptide repeat-containing protein, partial [Solirubrobacteraceae bacterium]|nr:pentapeptide repeat-containing protein [Solirubrobacteraceae bacterium]
DAIASALRTYSDPRLVASVMEPVSASLRHENRRRNAGACVAAYAQQYGPVADDIVRNASFLDVDFGNAAFRNVTFDNCEFIGSRLDRARFDACDAATSRFQSVVVTNASHLDFTGIVPGANFGSLIHPDVEDEIFSPQDVAIVLRRLGTPLPGSSISTFEYSPKAKVIIQLLQIMARAYRRANILFESDEHLTKLFGAKQWPALRKALTGHGIVREEQRAVAGPSVRTYRLLVALDSLVSGENADELPPGPIAEFWTALRAIPGASRIAVNA